MIYKADYVILEDKIEKDLFVEVEDGKVKSLSKNEPENFTYLEGILAPGLVDTHIHGYKNEDIMNAKKGALDIISQGLLETGVTSFLPTTLTDSTERLNEAVKVVGEEYKDVKVQKLGEYFWKAHFLQKNIREPKMKNICPILI